MRMYGSRGFQRVKWLNPMSGVCICSLARMRPGGFVQGTTRELKRHRSWHQLPNKRKHSLPLVAGTPKTLRFLVRPCCGR